MFCRNKHFVSRNAINFACENLKVVSLKRELKPWRLEFLQYLSG